MNHRLPAIHGQWLILIATVITVSIVTSTQLVTQRIESLLNRQASELLAADLVLVSNAPLSKNYQQKARAAGLSVAFTTNLRTTIFIADEPQLIELKAVSDAYPLRGHLEIAQDITAARQSVQTGPVSGEVWLDSKLHGLLGETIRLGNHSFKSSRLLTFEPDRAGALFNLAPRILMSLDDLSKTGLIIPGSRVRYRMLFSGAESNVLQFRSWLELQLTEGESVQNLENARPEMRRALERIRQFIALSIILTLVIAMVAIAITTSYSAGKEASKVAVLRAFGVSQPRLLRFYLLQIVKLWLIATLIGCAIGALAQYPLQWILANWFSRELPTVLRLQPYLTAALIGLISLVGCSLPYLVHVTATPPMQVFRPILSRVRSRARLLLSASAIVSLFLVLLLLVRSSQLAAVTLGLVLLVGLVLPFIFAALIRLLLVKNKRRFWLSGYLLSRLQSSSRGALLAMSGFCLVLLAILTIAIVKNELLAAWEDQLPADIPNYFLINLDEKDIAEIQQFLFERNIVTSDPYPLVRMRLRAINDVPVQDLAFSGARAKHLINRTFNVSSSDALPDGNQVIAGQWMAADNAMDQLSVEQSVAEDLQLKLGDTLSLSVAGETLKAPITSIRSVVWENFKPNFYFTTNRQLIRDKPQTWLISALIRDGQQAALKQLLTRFPAITLLDVSVILSRVRGIVEGATRALEFFFLFALASAFIVLLATIYTGRREREIESSLLRALAARSTQLYHVHVLEFMLMGILIGFFAALFANFTGWLLSVWFFDVDYYFSARIWGLSLISSVSVLTIAGTLVSRRVYHVSPMKILRS